jgi:hypothetical protein
MEQFLAYVAQFEPDFAKSIDGAGEAETSELERLVGMPLPSRYREFLERMGHDTGNLRLGGDASFAASELIEAYRKEILAGEIEVPRGSMLIGVGGMLVEEIYLELGGEDGRVLFLAADGNIHLFAESFEKLLYRTTFVKYRPRCFPFLRTYGSASSRRLLPPAEQMALNLGFDRQWFSDALFFCGERGDAALVISQYEGEGFLIVLAGTHESEVVSMAERFRYTFMLS